MIPRYSRPEMAAIWAPEVRLGIWLDVELAAAESMAEIGTIPQEPVRRLAAKIAAVRERLIDPARVEEIEATTRHDVIAFLTHVEEVAGEEARYLHLGMTSSDVLDTALAIQLGRGRRPDPGAARRAAGGAAPPRGRAQADAARSAAPRHPRRAHHLRPQARRLLRRVRAAPAGGWSRPRARRS